MKTCIFPTPLQARPIRAWPTCAILALCAASPGFTQTQLSLRDQARNVDFSQAVETRPFKTGTVLPAVCSTGDLFFKSDASAGQNMYGCTSPNTWTVEAGGSGSSSSLPGDFAISNTSNSVLTVGASCSVPAPCNYSNNNVTTLALTSPCTITLSGATSSGSVYVYISATGILTAGHNSSSTLTPNGTCAVTAGIVSFPDGATPVAIPSFASNIWATVTAAMDKRAFISASGIAAGTGISTVVNGSTGVRTVSTDSSIIPQYSTGSGTPAGACIAGRDLYTDTAAGNLSYCKATNVWAQVGGTYTLAKAHNQAATSLSGVANGTPVVITGTSTAVPGNTLGANGCLRYSFTLVAAGATFKDYLVSFGSASLSVVSNQNTTGALLGRGLICSAAATNTQNLSFEASYFGAALPTNLTTASMDATASQTVSVTVAPHGATGGSTDSVTLKDWVLEVIL